MMSTSRISFALSDQHKILKLKTRLSAIEELKEKKGEPKTQFTADDISQEFKLLECKNFTLQEKLIVETYKTALIESVHGKICSLTLSTTFISEQLAVSPPENNISTLKKYYQCFKENHPLLINIIKWTGFILLILPQIPFLVVLNGAGIVTGGLGLLLSLFHLTLPSTPFFLLITTILLLPSILGTFPIIAQLLMEQLSLTSPFHREPLMEIYLKQRKLTKSINNQLLLKDHSFSISDYEDLASIANMLNASLLSLKEQLSPPVRTFAMTCAEMIVSLISIILSVEVSLALSTLILTYGTHFTITSIATIAALNPITFPLIFIPLFIAASTFIYLLYMLQVNQLLNPPTQQFDKLNKKLDKDRLNDKWNNANAFRIKLFNKKKLGENTREPTNCHSTDCALSATV